MPSRAVGLLLARLALAPARAHPREELIELLWPGVGLDVGRNRLRQALSTLKALLERPAGVARSEVIAADRMAVRVVGGRVECDVLRFEAGIRSGDTEAARRCYGGPLLPGFFDEWVLDERRRLEDLAGRIGIDPDVPSLSHAITDVASIDGASSAPASSTPGAGQPPPPVAVTSLPGYLTTPYGMDEAIASLAACVKANRMVSIVGPGGSGKTRLAAGTAEVLARDRQAAFDPVAFVPLVSLRSPEDALDAVARSLAIEAPADVRKAIERALGGRRTLVVLDNCEQMAEGLGERLAPLLEALPELHVLATSRCALDLDGECLFIQPMLATPEAGADLDTVSRSPAVSLFEDRARRARADFHLGRGNAAVVAQLVRRLDGMPLAIELAAAQVRTLGPQRLLELLGQGRETLELIARSGPRAGGDNRHASMMDVLAWSWALLPPGARTLLEDVSVFPAGFTLEAAQALAGASRPRTARLVDELVRHSLLRNEAAGERYVPYELVREYAASQLDEARRLKLRALQRRWLLDWSAALPPTPPLTAVRDEMPTIVAVLAGAVDDGEPQAAVEILHRLRRCFEDVAPPPEALMHLQRAVQVCAPGVIAARGHAQLAGLLFNAGLADDALRSAQAAAAMVATPPDPATSTSPEGSRDPGLDEPGLQARIGHALASVLWRVTKRGDEALRLIGAAEPLALAAGALDTQASLLALRAFVTSQYLHDPRQAEALHQRAIDHWQRLGNRHAVHSGLYNLAVVASRDGRAGLALERIEIVLGHALALGDARRVRQALNVKGTAYTALRRWREAAGTLHECVRLSWAQMAVHDLTYGLWNLPRVLLHLHRAEAAVRVAGFVGAYWRDHFGQLTAEDRRDLRLVRRLAARSLSAGRIDALWREGELETLPKIVALALEASVPGAH